MRLRWRNKTSPPLIEFINAMEVREDDEEFKNPVDLMFDALEAEKPNHFAVRQYKKYRLAAGKTAKVDFDFLRRSSGSF